MGLPVDSIPYYFKLDDGFSWTYKPNRLESNEEEKRFDTSFFFF